MAMQIGMPSAQQFFVNTTLRIERVWFEFLQLIWNRTGGASGAPVRAIYPTFASLPANLPDGSQAIIQDATSVVFHAVAAGGGANEVGITLLSGVWRIG